MKKQLKKSELVCNAARCRNCLYVIQSRHVHNFVSCKCYNESGENIEKFPNKYKKDGHSWTKAFHKFVKAQHGIAIDGGTDYQRILFYNADDFEDLSIYE